MRILYDHQVFTWQDYGGISRYFYELINRQQGTAELSLVQSNNEYIRADLALSACVEGKPLQRRYSKLEKIFIPKKVRNRVPGAEVNQAHTLAKLAAGGYDLFHPTYYDRYFLEHLGGRPFVLTVYDMIHELYPEHFHLWDPVSPQKRELVQKAAHVIAISESTKRDLIDLYDVEESRISVTHLGSSFQADGPLSNLTLPGKYFLMVGSRGTYKNCHFTLRALSRLLRSHPEIHIVFAGGGRFSDDEKRFFAELGLIERVYHFPAGDADLRALYSRAEAFIFPSLYEGFGIPALEAFSCGCPLLASNTAALREVAGDAALYFEPKSSHELVANVERILSEPQLRSALKQKGAERLKQFSWDRCAEQTMEVYRKVLGQA